MKLALLAIGVVLSSYAADTAYIVGMYSKKERRGLSRHFTMKVDGKKIARLRFPTYYRIAVPPGVYNVTLDEKDRPTILCHLIAGESCYVRVKTVGAEDRAEVELISPHLAAVELQTLLPLEQERIHMKVWK
jgi:hypothetical protein